MANAKKIQEARRARDLTQVDLAIKVGLSPTTISLAERGLVSERDARAHRGRTGASPGGAARVSDGADDRALLRAGLRPLVQELVGDRRQAPRDVATPRGLHRDRGGGAPLGCGPGHRARGNHRQAAPGDAPTGVSGLADPPGGPRGVPRREHGGQARRLCGEARERAAKLAAAVKGAGSQGRGSG